MTATDQATNYDRYLDREDWPSESKGGNIVVSLMEPAHAYRAWWKLRKAYGSDWWTETVRFTPLAQALLRKALGIEVMFADTRPQVELFSDDELFVRSYDALMSLEKSGATHPMRRALLLAHYLAGKEKP